MSASDIKLGQLITTPQNRDAIHVAVAPVVAAGPLQPGEHVGLKPGESNIVGSYLPFIGVVDPYLTKQVKKGQQFWLCLYQNTVTSLRHNWTHPAFPDGHEDNSEAQKVMTALGKLGNIEAQEFMAKYAARVNMTIEDVIEAGKQYVESGERQYLNFNTPDAVYTEKKEFWTHFTTLTGIKVHEDNLEDTFFSCAC